MRVAVIRGLALCALVCGPLPAAAADDVIAVLKAEQRAIARINLAARQRYFVQKIAKSGCFALTAHRPQQNAKEAREVIERFDASFDRLVAGDGTADFAPETDQTTLRAITATQANWQTFRAATQQIVAGDWHTVPMAQVLRLNTVVLEEVNAAVDQIIATHSADLATQKAYAATVKIAGRQRMLIQKAAKEVCFISLDIDREAMRAGLAQTVALFETSLHALENGNFDMQVIDPPSLAVLVKISEIRTLWDQFRVLLAKAAEGGVLDSKEVAFVEETSGTLFEMANDLVGLYVKK